MLRRCAVRLMSSVAGRHWTTQIEGQADSLQYRVFLRLESDGQRLSFWHDLPVWANVQEGLITYVNEIPKGTTAKLEVSKDEWHNPIRQDTKKGQLRYIKYGPYPWNYGMVPQTYEDPQEKIADLDLVGDDDPIDVVELSADPLPVGAVRIVRPLGLLGLIDEGACDYKVLAIDARTPVRSLADLAGFDADALSEWFRLYKTAEGKPVNRFAYGALRPAPRALEVITAAHVAYRRRFGHLRVTSSSAP